MHKLSLALVLAGLSSTVTGQSGPGHADPANSPKPHAEFSGTALKAANPTGYDPASAACPTITQVNFFKGEHGATPGKWNFTVTTNGLSTAFGGIGGVSDGVVCGTYDTTVTPPTTIFNTQCATLNPPASAAASVFGLMVEPKLAQVALVDWSTGVRCAWRAAPPLPFGAPVTVANVPGTFVDPAAGYIDGQLHLFYVDATTGITAVPLSLVFAGGNLSSASVNTSAPLTVHNPGGTAHSPSPIIDVDGNVQGMVCSLSPAAGNSDLLLKAGLRGIDHAGVIEDTPYWLNNGGNAGGQIIYADSAGYCQNRESRVAWLVGSDTTVGTGGGKITATAGVFNTSPVVPFVNGTLFASLSTLSPVPLPGISGAVGINPSPLLINLGPISTTDADGVAFWSTTVPTPPPPGLVGFTLHIQALYSPVSGAGPVLSNNAYLRFK